MYELINGKVYFSQVEKQEVKVDAIWCDCNQENIFKHFTLSLIEYHLTSNHLSKGLIRCPMCNHIDYEHNFKNVCPTCEINISVGFMIITIWR